MVEAVDWHCSVLEDIQYNLNACAQFRSNTNTFNEKPMKSQTPITMCEMCK